MAYRFLALTLVQAVFLASSLVHASEREQWNAAWSLNAAGDAPLARVELPAEVYGRMDPTSGSPDIALYTMDSAGEPLPWRLVPQVQAPDESLWVAIPGMALASQDSILPGTLVRTLQISDGALSVRYGVPAEESHSDGIQWLLDVRGKRFRSLRLQVDSNSQVLGSAQLESSNDLLHWNPMGEPVGIAHVSGSITVRSLDLPLTDSVGFLRLKLKAGQGVWHLQGILGLRVLAGRSSDQGVAQLDVTAADSVGWWYRTGGPFPVMDIAVESQSPGTWARVRLDARASDSEPWQTVTTLDAGWWQAGGADVRSPWKHLAQEWRCGWWRVVPLSGKASLGAAPPKLRVSWSPDLVEFSRGGRDSVWLVAGIHSRKRPPHLLLTGVFPGAPIQAGIGSLQELSGSRALESPSDRTQIVLWGLLLVAILVLAGFAVKLWKEHLPAAEEGKP